MQKNNGFTWNFHRIGGLDQVVLDSDDDFRNLRNLDPKLWVALSCPSSGLELDDRTLALIDEGKDGRIRIPEVLSAVDWLCLRLKNPSDIKNASDNLPLDAINMESEEGRYIAATVRIILENLDKPDATSITLREASDAVAHVTQNIFNGDGVVPPWPEFGEDMQRFIQDGVAVVGGLEDASGKAGLTRELVEAFLETLKAWKSWQNNMSGASTSLGRYTRPAWDLYQELRGKIDDYFLRCELAAYAPQALGALNVDEKFMAPLAQALNSDLDPALAGMPSEKGMLAAEALSELPLSKVEADRPLNLKTGLNPVWRDRIERFVGLVKPLLTDESSLSRDNWHAIKKSLAPYAEALSKKPAPVSIPVTIAPVADPDSLGDERIDEILGSDLAERFIQLADKDRAVPAAASDMADVERLVRYYCNMYRLLRNFVSFADFYTLKGAAAFQAGTLYIDGRSCELSVIVQDVAKHSGMAALSGLHLVYCVCKRTGEDGKVQTMNIASAVTAGDADLLVDNRNGVFVDTKGRDWDATVVKVIVNPISIRQAFMSPYKRIGKLVSDQINKYASAKDEGLISSATQKLSAMSVPPPPAAGAAPAKFDIGRSVGIFAAVGLALGAIGTALATIASSLLALKWWQFPLLLLAIFLIISGPSVLMAALKLRKRTLGPLLEASGWAINGRVFINFLLGRLLTSEATLPPHSSRSFRDPLRKRRRWPWVVLILAILFGAAVFLWWWFFYRTGTPLPFFGGGGAAPAAK